MKKHEYKEENCAVCGKPVSECICKKEETKEQTGADSSGSYEAPMSAPILKRDIHNFAPKKEVGEQMSAGAYDGPIGHAGPSSPMDHTKKKRSDPLAIDNPGKGSKNESGSASITAASTKDMISTKKGFPRFGGPEAKFVEIDKRCKTFPYCNQGDDHQIKLVSEIKGMKEAIQVAAKKYGISPKQVEKIILKEATNISEALPRGMMDDPGNERALKSWGDKGPKPVFTLTTEHPIEIKTTDESEIAKLKMVFFNHDIKFNVDMGHASIDSKPLNIKTPDPESDDDGTDFGDNDDIFANMK